MSLETFKLIKSSLLHQQKFFLLSLYMLRHFTLINPFLKIIESISHLWICSYYLNLYSLILSFIRATSITLKN